MAPVVRGELDTRVGLAPEVSAIAAAAITAPPAAHIETRTPRRRGEACGAGGAYEWLLRGASRS